MSLERAVSEIRQTMLRANVCGNLRIALTFENDRDLAYFKRQLVEDLKHLMMDMERPAKWFDEFTLHGIHIRLIGDIRR